MNKRQDRFFDGWRFQFIFNIRVLGLLEFSEQDGDFSDELECPFKQESNGSHLSQDISPRYIRDSRFIDNFHIFFQGAVGSFGS